MAAIRFENVHFHYDEPFAPVFEGLSVAIDTQWRTALVGRNGRGKTTLLQLLRREIWPTRGVVAGPAETSYFPYEPREPARPTLQVIRECIAPFDSWEGEMETLLRRADDQSLARYGQVLETYENLGGYDVDARIEREMRALGMDPRLLPQSYESLSGGEQTRALIVALFLRKDRFPLIDEPTNHLDMEGRELLGAYLASKAGFLLVSHDRHFLDLCTDHVLAMRRKDVELTAGSFSEWKRQADRAEEHERRTREKLEREVRSLERAARQRRQWSDTKEKEKIGSKDDKGRIGHLAAKQMKRALSIKRRTRERVEKKRSLLRNAEKERQLKLEPKRGARESLLSVVNLGVDIGSREILSRLNFTLAKGERVAVVGPNGSGKTTLLSTIAGELEPTRGSVDLPRHVSRIVSHQVPRWNRGLLRDHLEREEIDETRFRTILGSLSVSGAVFDRPLETFSQGERKKVDLCRSFLEPTHLLLWDEPLNYIDLASRDQIERVVLQHEPTLLFVEHDRWFVERVATGVVDLGSPSPA